MLRWLLLATLPAPAADWQPAGPFGGSVLSVAIDARQPGNLLAGARNGQLFRSLDHGASWQQGSFGRPLAGNVQVLAADPTGQYWAGISGEQASSNGLWKSADSGRTWTQMLAGLAVESLALFPARPNTIAAGTRHGLYVTSDGTSWNRITPQGHSDLEDIVSVAFDPRDARVIYAGTPHLPWKTTDGGRTWASVHSGMLDDSDVFSLQVSAANSSHLFASACSGIYRSLDAGGRWKLLEGIPNGSRRTHIILQDPHDPKTVYAGTTAGLFRSDDGGDHWTRLNTLQTNFIAIDRSNPDTLYLATEHAGLQISYDRGTTLKSANQGIHTRNVSAVVNIGSLVYAATAYEREEGGVFVASASGWRRVATSAAFGLDNLHSLAADGKRLFAATGQQAFQSADGGRSWKAFPGKLPAPALALTIAGDRLWLGTASGLFLQSGSAWVKAPTAGNGPIRSFGTAGRYLLARGDNVAHVSSDTGSTWKPVAAEALFDAAISCQGTTLLATTPGLFVAVTGKIPVAAEGIPAGTVSAVAFHPLRCQEAYATQFGRLYVSRDGGWHWQAAEAAAGLAAATKLWISSASPDWIFATVPGAGLFRRSLLRE